MSNKERYFEEKMIRIYESVYLGKAEEEISNRSQNHEEKKFWIRISSN